MKRKVLGVVAGLGVAGATAGILVTGAANAEPPPSQPAYASMTLQLSPEPLRAGEVVNIDTSCDGDRLEVVHSEAFTEGVAGRHPAPNHFVGQAKVGNVAPGSYVVTSECGYIQVSKALTVVQ